MLPNPEGWPSVFQILKPRLLYKKRLQQTGLIEPFSLLSPEVGDDEQLLRYSMRGGSGSYRDLLLKLVSAEGLEPSTP